MSLLPYLITSRFSLVVALNRLWWKKCEVVHKNNGTKAWLPRLVAWWQAPRGRRLPGTHASLECADDRRQLYQPAKCWRSGPCVGTQSSGNRFLRGYNYQALAGCI